MKSLQCMAKYFDSVKTIIFLNLSLTPSIRAPPGGGGVMGTSYVWTPQAWGFTLSFCFGISNDKIFLFVASFHKMTILYI